MKIYRGKLFSPVLLILALFFSTQACALGKPEVNRLRNGMQVVLQEDRSSPLVTCVVGVKVGSAYEGETTNGLTHFLEHLLFDGTEKFSREALKAEYDSHGIYFNAFTREDYTAYEIVAPRDFIGIGIGAQAQQLLHSTFPDAEFPKERKVVIEEIKKDEDNPSSQASDLFNKAFYKGTPYGRPVIGYDTLIERVPKDSVLRFYSDHYAPSNMVAAVVGDFDRKAVLAELEEAYGGIPRRSIPPAPRIQLPSFSGEVRKEQEAVTRSYLVSLGFPGPLVQTKDGVIFDLLCQILVGGDDSRIVRALTGGGEPLVNSVEGGYSKLLGTGTLTLTLVLSDGSQVDPAIAKIKAELSRVVREGVAENELARAKRVYLTDAVFANERLVAKGRDLVQWAALGDVGLRERYLSGVPKVTSQEVQDVAKKYFSRLNYVITILAPKDAKPGGGPGMGMSQGMGTMPSLSGGSSPPASSGSLPQPRPHASGGREVVTERAVLPNGLVIIACQNPYTEITATNVLVGNRIQWENEGTNGVGDLVQELIDKGSGGKSAESVAQSLASIGARLKTTDLTWMDFDDYYFSKDYAYLRLETLNDFDEHGWDLLAEMMLHPSFPSGEIEKAKANALSLISRDEVRTNKAAKALWFRTAFPRNNYRFPIYGTAKSIQSITREDILSYFRKAYAPNNLVIAVVSDRSPKDVIASLTKRFNGMAKGEVKPSAYVPEIPPQAAVKVTQFVDKEQAYLLLGNLLPGIRSEDVPAIEVMNDILSSRLGLSLREKEGLAYSVGSGVDFSKDVGWFYAAMGTRNENLERAAAGLLEQFRLIREKPVTEGELQTSINSFWGHWLRYHQTAVNQAHYLTLYEFLGMGYGFDSAYPDKLRKVTAADVQRAAQRYVSMERYILSIAGRVKQGGKQP
jgi:zinc protease